MWDSASPADFVAFLNRIDSSVLANRTTREAWIEFLKKNGGTGGTLNEMETNWLNSKSSGNGSGQDKADMYMNSKGFSGTRRDKIRAYLRGSATQ